MHTITVKIEDNKNKDFLLELLGKLNFISSISSNDNDCKELDSGNIDYSCFVIPEAKPDITDFAGLWENSPKTLEQIREKAWQRI